MPSNDASQFKKFLPNGSVKKIRCLSPQNERTDKFRFSKLELMDKNATDRLTRILALMAQLKRMKDKKISSMT